MTVRASLLAPTLRSVGRSGDDAGRCRLVWWRRCARTRFIPDDWGLKPPIDALPQIAQERAMMSSEGSDSAERRAGWARAGQYDTTHLGGSRPTARRAYGERPVVPPEPIPGRALATRRAVMDIVRAATLGSYGVAGFAGGPIERALAVLEGRPPGT